MARGVYRVRPIEQFIKYPRRRWIPTLADPNQTIFATVITGVGTVQTPYVTPVQIARPGSDVSRVGWVDQVGGTTNLWATLDEVAFDDADYITITVTA